ncbi:hypothetical protein PYCC9005_001649 [Savitreella phatthalungensis]
MAKKTSSTAVDPVRIQDDAAFESGTAVPETVRSADVTAAQSSLQHNISHQNALTRPSASSRTPEPYPSVDNIDAYQVPNSGSQPKRPGNAAGKRAAPTARQLATQANNLLVQELVNGKPLSDFTFQERRILRDGKLPDGKIQEVEDLSNGRAILALDLSDRERERARTQEESARRAGYAPPETSTMDRPHVVRFAPCGRCRAWRYQYSYWRPYLLSNSCIACDLAKRSCTLKAKIAELREEVRRSRRDMEAAVTPPPDAAASEDTIREAIDAAMAAALPNFSHEARHRS